MINRDRENVCVNPSYGFTGCTVWQDTAGDWWVRQIAASGKNGAPHRVPYALGTYLFYEACKLEGVREHTTEMDRDRNAGF
jgi:hypothetical protein